MRDRSEFTSNEKWLEYQLCWAMRIHTRLGLMECKIILIDHDWHFSDAIAFVNSDEYKKRTRFRL